MSKPHAASASDENIWESLPFPLEDLFLQEIAPKYLTIRDFLTLSSVSTRYHDLLGPKTEQGNRILGILLQRKANHYHPVSGELLYTDQLPTIGNFTVEESLQDDAMAVLKMMGPAERRRSLALLPHNTFDSEERQHQLQELVATHFRPKSRAFIRGVVHIYPRLRPHQPTTEFMCINLSGEDLYCHWIDESGNIVVREGDRIAPKPSSEPQQVCSFRVNDLYQPPGPNCNIFRHTSVIQHGFALSYQEGGPPFCIYRQNRGWYRAAGINDVVHTHAIAVWPGGRVLELHCDKNWTVNPAGDYQFMDRNTGEPIPMEYEEEPPAVDDFTRAKGLAEEFYGVNLPLVDDDPTSSWSVPDTGSIESLKRTNPLGEAMWKERNNISLEQGPQRRQRLEVVDRRGTFEESVRRRRDNMELRARNEEVARAETRRREGQGNVLLRRIDDWRRRMNETTRRLQEE